MSMKRYDVAFAGICGSDLQKTNHTTSLDQLREFGHELVIKTEQGMAIVNPMLSCKHCSACTTKGEMFCDTLSAIGREHGGGLSGSVRLPETNIVPIRFSRPSLGVLADPLAVVLHGLQYLAYEQRHILIIGDGTIAQLTMLCFALSDRIPLSCTLLVKSEKRASAMRREYGQILATSRGKMIITHTPPEGQVYDTVIECVGRAQSTTLQTAHDYVDVQGTILSFGVYPAKYYAELDIRTLLYKEARLIGSNSYNHNDLIKAVDIMSKHEALFSLLLDEVMPNSGLQRAFSKARNKSTVPKKVYVSFEVS